MTLRGEETDADSKIVSLLDCDVDLTVAVTEREYAVDGSRVKAGSVMEDDDAMMEAGSMLAPILPSANMCLFRK